MRHIKFLYREEGNNFLIRTRLGGNWLFQFFRLDFSPSLLHGRKKTRVTSLAGEAYFPTETRRQLIIRSLHEWKTIPRFLLTSLAIVLPIRKWRCTLRPPTRQLFNSGTFAVRKTTHKLLTDKYMRVRENVIRMNYRKFPSFELPRQNLFSRSIFQDVEGKDISLFYCSINSCA